MTEPEARSVYSIAEYLRFEETAEERHEFHDGVITPMQPNPYRHSIINANLLGCLVGELRRIPFAIVGGTMRVRTGTGAHYVYPDATVIREPPEFDTDDPRKTTLVNPRLIVETMAPWTEQYDRGRKFDLYRETPSLREYILISDKTPKIVSFHLDHAGVWCPVAEANGLDDVVPLVTLGLRLPLREVYRGVELRTDAV
jgi:Uma2 family endonuclease